MVRRPTFRYLIRPWLTQAKRVQGLIPKRIAASFTLISFSNTFSPIFRFFWCSFSFPARQSWLSSQLIVLLIMPLLFFKQRA